MRGLVLGFAALGLAACDSGNVPSPTERMNEQGSGGPSISLEGVELRGGGLAAGSEAFYFSAGQNEVIGALAGVLGDAGEAVSNDECGAGPMQFASFPGGLTVNFQESGLVGWNIGLSDEPAAKRIDVVGDVQIGTGREAAQAADGFNPFEDSTLGEEFSLGPNIGGFIEEGSVAMMYAGTQCFFR